MADPVRTIPYDNTQGLRRLVEYLLQNIGKISIHEFDDLDYIINKIDGKTLIVKDNQLQAAIDPNNNIKILFEYNNTNSPSVPTKMEVFDITTNDLIESEELTHNTNNQITKVVKKDENGVAIKQTDYTHTPNGNRSNITEINVQEL